MAWANLDETSYYVPGLDRFLASAPFYSHPSAPGLRYTEGVNYIVDEMGADWVVAEIHKAQSAPALKDVYYQRWVLWVENDLEAGMICYDRDRNEIFSLAIPITDYQRGETTIFMVGRRLFLPH
jgi:hypothetical protein